MFGIRIGTNKGNYKQLKFTIMKHLFIGLTLLVLIIGKNSLANVPGIPATVTESFENTFGQSTDVVWSEAQGLYKAVFTIGEKRIIQYYNQEGDVISIARYINGSELSPELFSKLKKNADHYAIKEIFEVSNEMGTTYYATLEDKQNIVVLQASGKDWKQFKKMKK
jgi:hypothetical protein